MGPIRFGELTSLRSSATGVLSYRRVSTEPVAALGRRSERPAQD